VTLPNQGPGRVLAGFGASFWEGSPTWVVLDDLIGVNVAGYTIDRGRQVEIDRTDVGRAAVTLFDTTGILDPGNAASPYHAEIQPLIPIAIQRRNPMTDVWHTRYRGWVETWTIETDRSQAVNRVRIDCVDIFEALAAIDLTIQPFSDPYETADEDGSVTFAEQIMGDRVKRILQRAGVPSGWYVVFSGNVGLFRTSYSPGSESAMTAIQEAVDAELPTVSNVYADRVGRLAAHGRLSKRDPEVVIATITDPNTWDWSRWKAGDGDAVAADVGQVAQLREFGYNRGVSSIVNRAYCVPRGNWTVAELNAQVYTSAAGDASIAKYGVRSWSAEQLLTGLGLEDSADALTETKRFAEWRVENFAQARNRATACSFRTIQPGRVGSGITWELLCEIDISDQLTLYVSGPQGIGGMDGAAFYVEGIHEVVRPANADFDDVTLSVDISPRAVFDHWPFPDVTTPDVDPD